MTDSGKREESISELIDKLDDIREQLFHVQRSLEIIETKSKEIFRRVDLRFDNEYRLDFAEVLS